MQQIIHLLLSALLCVSCTQQSPTAIKKVPSPSTIEIFSSDSIVTFENTRLIVHKSLFEIYQTSITQEQVDSMALKITRANNECKNWLKVEDSTLVKIEVFPTIECKGLERNNTQPAEIDNGKIFIVKNEIFNGINAHLQLQVLLDKHLSTPQYLALRDGIRLQFSPEWQNKGALHWAKLLHQSNNLPSLHEILDNELYEKESNIVFPAAAASFVQYMLQAGKKAFLLELYTGKTRFSMHQIETFENEWLQYLSQLPYINKSRIKKPKDQLLGFNFAHEGYRIYNSYGSRLAEQSLDSMSGISANAVAIVPYTYMPSNHKPSFLPFMRSAGTETDESIIQSMAYAKKLGFTTLLKPQIWVRNSWPGDIDMTDAKDWNQFFDYYYRWIRHYTILAEIHHTDILCLGVELSKSTLKHPEKWTTIFHRLKALYSGHITYAANWGEEFEQLTFWYELDFISINCYYPLSPRKKASDEALKKELQKKLLMIKSISQKERKPFLFTEIGYRSTANCWINPHAEAGTRPFSEKDQARAYRITCETLREENFWAGIFWWKWPSYLSYGGDEHKGFSPYGKEAEAVVADFFGQ